MNRIWTLVCCALALALLACGKKIEEKDMVGTWNVDPAAVAGKDKNSELSQIRYNLNPDHSFVMFGPVQMTVKGTWAFSEMKLTMTPATVTGPNPIDPTKTVEAPIAPALEALRTTKQNDDLLEALETMAQATTFEVSSDGKKLSDAGKPALVKSD